MSYADKVFKGMCRDILDNGVSTEGEKVRPVWEDTNESAYTIKKFGVVNGYDLRKEFPALTLRRKALKSAFDELLWIWRKCRVKTIAMEKMPRVQRKAATRFFQEKTNTLAD